jgi:hypothetical protein
MRNRPNLNEFAFETEEGHDVFHTGGGYTVFAGPDWIGSCRTQEEARTLSAEFAEVTV